MDGRISDAKRRLLERLKLGGAATATDLAAQLGLTDVAVRQHLAALQESGLVGAQTQPAKGRGRPSERWSLTRASDGVFGDRHAELTCGLIEAARQAFGAEGLQRLVQIRADGQTAAYRRQLPGKSTSLAKRVEALARQRSAEGYMATVTRERPGSYLLIEHHCPICDAASACTGLCSAELEVFQRALGDEVSVERVEHLLSGGERCVYRITRSSTRRRR